MPEKPKRTNEELEAELREAKDLLTNATANLSNAKAQIQDLLDQNKRLSEHNRALENGISQLRTRAESAERLAKRNRG